MSRSRPALAQLAAEVFHRLLRGIEPLVGIGTEGAAAVPAGSYVPGCGLLRMYPACVAVSFELTMPFDPLDVYGLKRAFARTNELRTLVRETADPAFLVRARRALLPVPLLEHPPTVENPLPAAPRRKPARGLERKQVAIVCSGGSGACIATIGVARAFEEAGIRPASITACSGSAIWAAMWASGMSANEMARFSLSWQPQDYLDIQWGRLPRFALSALRGFTGLAKGDAVEHLLDERLRSLPMQDTPIPINTIVFNMDLGRVEYFGSHLTPDLTLGRLVRIAIALPLFIEAVTVGEHLYVDGGIIELFPAEPVIDDADIDHVFGLNFMLPPQFEPEDITGWHQTPLGVLKASRQLEQGYQLEFARRAKRRLGGRLTIIDPVDYRELRGVSFYDLFIDRSQWPRLIRQGYDSATLALDAFRGSAPRTPRHPSGHAAVRSSS